MIEIMIIILIVVELYACFRYRDLISPAVLHNIMWIVAGIVAITMVDDKNIENVAILVIIIGSIFFQIGFSISLRIKLKNNFTNEEVKVNEQATRFLVMVVFAVAIPVIVQYIMYLRSAGSSMYDMLQSTEENLNLPSMFDYFRRIVQYLSIAMLICYWKSEYKQAKRIKKYVYLLLGLAILSAISVPTRNGILFFLLPLIVAFIATHDISNKKICIIGICSVVGFMMVFYWISLGKYWYLYKNASSSSSIIQNEIRTYLSGGIVAFLENLKKHSFTDGGSNTFRFFIAIGDRVFKSNHAVKLVKEFVDIGNGTTTNVFTFYDFYVRDFGCLYAILMQFIYACIHGIAYKQTKKGNLLQIYFFAFLSYPLIMQFFQDQYMSLLSTWIQIIIVGVFIFKISKMVK